MYRYNVLWYEDGHDAFTYGLKPNQSEHTQVPRWNMDRRRYESKQNDRQ